MLEEVANATGWTGDRSADALVMELWKPHSWHGFEIKASRADWLRELKDPTKADAFKRYMDYWWLVVGDDSIVKDGELPEGWGLLVPTTGRVLFAKKGAPMLKPEPIPRVFMAAIVRRVVEQSVDTQLLVDAAARGRVDGWNLAMSANKSIEGHRAQLRHLRTEVKGIMDHINATLRGGADD
jgi:hypothetical protein